MNPTTFEQVLDHYRGKLAGEEATVKRCGGRWSTVGYIRGFLFLAFLVPLVMGFVSAFDRQTIWWILAGLLFVAFAVVAFIHEKMQSDLKLSTLLTRMHKESIARCERDWSGMLRFQRTWICLAPVRCLSYWGLRERRWERRRCEVG